MITCHHLPYLAHILPGILLPNVPNVEDVDAAVFLHTDPGVCWHNIGASGQNIIAPPPDYQSVACEYFESILNSVGDGSDAK